MRTPVRAASTVRVGLSDRRCRDVYRTNATGQRARRQQAEWGVDSLPSSNGPVGPEYPATTVQMTIGEESMTPRPTRLWGTLAAALVVSGIGCHQPRR